MVGPRGKITSIQLTITSGGGVRVKGSERERKRGGEWNGIRGKLFKLDSALPIVHGKEWEERHTQRVRGHNDDVVGDDVLSGWVR